MARADVRDPSGGSLARRNSKRRILTSTYVGTVIEWFDFYVYATAAALVFATALLAASGGAPNHLWVAVFMLVVCLLPAAAAWSAPEMNQRVPREVRP